MSEEPTCQYVTEPAKDRPVLYDVDVAVAGAGLCSTFAAIAAGRCGAKTLLVERFGNLCGNVGPAMVVNGGVFRERETTLPDGFAGIADEFVERLKSLQVGPEDRYPEDASIRVILDNHSAHTSKETRHYLASVPNRFDFIFTPTHGSWLNLIEAFFGKMAKTMLRGIRVSSKAELKERIEKYLDEGHGSGALQQPKLAELVEDTLLRFDGDRYCLHAWAIMPTHVHTLLTVAEGHGLPRVIHSWKSFTALVANRLLGRRGAFWQREYFDRFIRNARHYEWALRYIEENPVAAGLCARVEEWPFGSARLRVSDR